jgi:RNA recognition motif-containing protein
MSDEQPPNNTEENSPPAEAPQQEEEDAGFKVFVGNLSFQTTEEQLAEFFAPAGNVLKANIITRGTRSLGYGFVAYATLAEAEAATVNLDKKELGGREINVEVAKPKAEGEAARNRAAKGEGSRARGVRRGRGRGRGPSRSRGGWSGPRRFGRRRESDVEGGEGGAEATAGSDDATAAGETKDVDESGEVKEPKKSRGRSRRTRGSGRTRGRGRSGLNKEDGEGGESAEAGEPSKTTVFVANLPFSTNDSVLVELFKDFNIKSAHVVKGRSGRSKGFGFVDLVDEEEQQKVLEQMKGIKHEDRELIIKVALSEPHVQEKEVAVENTPAAATASSDDHPGADW